MILGHFQLHNQSWLLDRLGSWLTPLANVDHDDLSFQVSKSYLGCKSYRRSDVHPILWGLKWPHRFSKLRSLSNLECFMIFVSEDSPPLPSLWVKTSPTNQQVTSCGDVLLWHFQPHNQSWPLDRLGSWLIRLAIVDHDDFVIPSFKIVFEVQKL